MRKNNKLPTIKENICKKACLISFLFFAISLGSQICFSNKLAMQGGEFAKLYHEKELLEKSIAKIEYENATLSSLDYIKQSATNLGFVPMEQKLGLIKFTNEQAAIFTN